MRSVSIWILLAAVSLVAYSEVRRRPRGVALPAMSTARAGVPPALAATPPRVTAATAAKKTVAATAESPVAVARVAAVSPAAAGRAARYAALSDKALAAGDRLHAAIYARARLHAITAEAGPADLALPLRLEREAVVAANRASAAVDASGQRTELTVAYFATPDRGRRARYAAILAELARATVLAPGDSTDLQVHVVRAGESLARIARRYHFPVEGIRRLNRLRSTVIRIGQRLRVWRGPIEILVSKSDFELTLLQAGRFVRVYGCGIGKDDSSPEALFQIAERQIDPTWYGPRGVFPSGDPGNLLGTRWLGFRDTSEHHGFGIHGTRMPNSIGKAASSGCIRLRNADVEDLFAFVPRGARVTIVR